MCISGRAYRIGEIDVAMLVLVNFQVGDEVPIHTGVGKIVAYEE
jgi:hypothetical protein